MGPQRRNAGAEVGLGHAESPILGQVGGISEKNGLVGRSRQISQLLEVPNPLDGL